MQVFMLAVFAFCAITGCIENDIPYPTIKLFVEQFEVEGQRQAPTINTENQTISVVLTETADADKVLIKNLVVTEGAKSTINVGEYVDLRDTLGFTLSLYQEYPWRIVATQPIARYFDVEDQIGESNNDPTSRVAVTHVHPATNLRKVIIKRLKLAPEGATYTLLTQSGDVEDFLDQPVDFREQPLQVRVNYKDQVEIWSLFVKHKTDLVTTLPANPWAKVVWMHAESFDTPDRGFEYRKASSDTWTRVAPEYVTHKGSSFSARVPHLEALTEYVIRAYVGESVGNEVTATTYATFDLPNGDLENWWKKDDKQWNPWLEGDVPFWDTGNAGTVTLNKNITTPTTETWNGSEGTAAKLESQFVNLFGIGKFAAGNLFVGQFMKVDGTNGILNFGQPFTTFPTRVRLYYKYKSAPIDKYPTDLAHLAGKPDSCIVYAALGDWEQPVEIRTNPKNQKLFDVNDKHIIAYTEFVSAEDQPEYRELVLEFDYRDLTRRPTYLVFVASASKYGDFFAGGIGSTMYLDNIRLEYDYD